MSAPVQAGEILDGKYSIERILGEGGMGVVVAARHLHLDQRVAIKFLLAEALQDQGVVARFAREARAAAKIQSEHVARVIDVSNMPNGAPYMVMEYLDGCDLSQLLKDRGALTIPEAVDYVLQGCEALAEAHAAGIIHRDLKPANLFLARRADGGSIVKVLDFGISKLSDMAEAHMTKTSTVMGSPLYMSPEQLKSTRNVDARSDIWSIGVMLHELLSGKVPFNAETMPQLCAMILSEAPPPLRYVRPDAPAGLELVIQNCIQQDPNRRYANVAALAADLCAFGSAGAHESAGQIARVLQSAGMLAAGMVPPAPGSNPSMRPGQPPSNPSLPAPPGSNPSFRSLPHHVSQSVSQHHAPPQGHGALVQGASTGTAWGGSSQINTGGPMQVTGTGPYVAPAPQKSAVPMVLVGIGVALLIVVSVGAAMLVRRPKAEAATTASSAAVSVAAPPSASGAASVTTLTPGEPATIQLSITAHPADAKIFVDDAEVGANPYTAKLKMTGTSHKVRIEAPGYETQQKFAVFDKDVKLDVDLVAEKAKDPKARKPGPGAHPGKPGGKMYDDPYQ